MYPIPPPPFLLPCVTSTLQCWARSVQQYEQPSTGEGGQAEGRCSPGDIALLLNSMPTEISSALSAAPSLRERLRRGELHPKVAEVIAHRSFWCEVFLDDFSKPSAWEVSAPLRAVLYSACLLGPHQRSAEVTEFSTVSGSYTRRTVTVSLGSPSAVFRWADTPNLPLRDRAQLLCMSMGVPYPTHTLGPGGREEDWALPMLALAFLARRDSGSWRAREVHSIVAMALCGHHHHPEHSRSGSAQGLASTSSSRNTVGRGKSQQGSNRQRKGDAIGSGNTGSAGAAESVTLRTVRLCSQWQSTLFVCSLLSQCLGSPFPSIRPSVVCDGPRMHTLLSSPHPTHSPEVACPLLCGDCAADAALVAQFRVLSSYVMPSKNSNNGQASSAKPVGMQGRKTRTPASSADQGKRTAFAAAGAAAAYNPFSVLGMDEGSGSESDD